MSEHATETCTPVAVVEGVTKSFGRRTVLEGIDLAISPGEVVGIVGPNGGGKSTLLSLMAGLLQPTEGSVRVTGVEAHALSRSAAGTVGLVTARPGLYPLLTGRENLHHFGGLYGLTQDEVDEKAAPLVQALQLREDLQLRVGAMSTGMQQKVSLVRALLLSPALLLFDEPTANLDPIASRVLYTELRRRGDLGLACVLVTHELAAAESVCDRVLLLDRTIQRELHFSEQRVPEPGPLAKAWQEVLG